MNEQQAFRFLRDNPSPGDVTPDVVNQWIQVIGYFHRHPHKEAIPLLINTFGEGDHMDIYTCIQAVLQRFSLADMYPHLDAGLQSDNLGIRCWCADSIRYFPHPDFIPGLRLLLKNSDPLARYEAAVALERITHRSVCLVAAEALLRETDEDVRDVLQDMVRVA